MLSAMPGCEPTKGVIRSQTESSRSTTLTSDCHFKVSKYWAAFRLDVSSGDGMAAPCQIRVSTKEYSTNRSTLLLRRSVISKATATSPCCSPGLLSEMLTVVESRSWFANSATVLLVELVTAKSMVPTALISSAVTSVGRNPSRIVSLAVYVPRPSFKYVRMEFVVLSATAKSE